MLKRLIHLSLKSNQGIVNPNGITKKTQNDLDLYEMSSYAHHLDAFLFDDVRLQIQFIEYC